MKNHLPYTYLIKFIHPIDKKVKFYYGVSYGKNANPDNLFVKYFTSSKIIKKLIKEYGTGCFAYEIRKVFPNKPKKAFTWEQKVIKRMNLHKRDDFLNSCLGGKCYVMVGDKNPSKRLDVREKISTAVKRWYETNNNPFLGKKHTEKTKKLISEKNKGRKDSQLVKHKKSMAKIGKSRLDDFKQKCSERMRGSRNHMYGRTGNWAHINTNKQSCPHCNIETTIGNLKRWHIDNCKFKTS